MSLRQETIQAETTTRSASSQHGLALLLLLACGSLTAVGFAFGKAAAAAGVSALPFVFVTATVAGLVLLAVTIMQGQMPRLGGRYLRYCAIAGLVSYALPNAIAFMAVPRIGTGLVSIAWALSPSLTYVLAMALRLDRPRPARMVGIASAVAGVAVIVWPGADGFAGLGPEGIWMVLALASPLALATGNVYRTVGWPPGIPGMPLACGMLLAGAIWLLPVAVASGELGRAAQALPQAWPYLAAQSIGASVMFALYFPLQRIGGPVVLSLIGSVGTVVGLLLGWLLFGEQYAAGVLPGVVLILLGVGFVTRRT
ncbi:MAG TPA: DMT family transporter [Azospirillaceae bacterium]|nr:DMT family transporter [Azospirillaceae bacterium]